MTAVLDCYSKIGLCLSKLGLNSTTTQRHDYVRVIEKKTLKAHLYTVKVNLCQKFSPHAPQIYPPVNMYPRDNNLTVEHYKEYDITLYNKVIKVSSTCNKIFARVEVQQKKANERTKRKNKRNGNCCKRKQ